jgi:hypothetical protein
MPVVSSAQSPVRMVQNVCVRELQPSLFTTLQVQGGRAAKVEADRQRDDRPLAQGISRAADPLTRSRTGFSRSISAHRSCALP